MSDIVNITSILGLGSNMQENDSEVVSYFKRIRNITDIIVDEYPSNIIDIMISPITLINTKLKQVGGVDIWVTWHLSENSIVSEFLIKEYIKTAYDCELTDAKSVSIHVSRKPKLREPAILLYSIFGDLNIANMNSTDYNKLRSLASSNYEVYLPNNFDYVNKRAVFIKCSSLKEVADMQMKSLIIEDSYRLTPYRLYDKNTEITFIPIVSNVLDELPYTLLSSSLFENEDSQGD